MRRTIQQGGWWIVAAMVVWSAGCGGRPARISAPTIDAAAAGRQAIELYDKNGDGVLDAEELKQVPGILGALSRYDRNGDGRVSAEEIAERIAEWQAYGVGLMSFGCSVYLDGQPLEGATVFFDPEPFLGGKVAKATGVTGNLGSAVINADDADLPEDQRGLGGVQQGIYKVRITHPSRNLPARYNTETALGFEVAQDAEMETVRFDLSTR